MCGICGIIGTDTDHTSLPAMMAMLQHRGPNEQGSYRVPGVSFGHTRLSIIGLDSGKQPIFNEDGSIVILVNGEIYNYLELKQSLEKKGHRFSTHSDSEVLVHLYEEHGPACVNALEGMFAFALWDTRQRTVLLGRDRTGIKPLYYHTAPGTLLFASEIKALLVHPQVSRSANVSAMDQLLTYRFIPGKTTLFNGIYKLLPGETARYNMSEQVLQIERYWQPHLNLEQERFSEARAAEHAQKLLRLLEESVRSHLMSEVPLGATLSGGLDSSLIVALMQKYSSRKVQTFSIAFENGQNELPFAQRVADHVGTEHHALTCDHQDLFDLLPTILWHVEEPIVGSLIPTYLLAEKLKQHLTVLLIGEGADELFGGYIRFKTLQLPAPSSLRSWAFLKGNNAILGHEKDRLYSPSFLKQVGTKNDGLFRSYLNKPGSDTINKALWYEQENQLPNLQLLRVDKLTMAHSLEARVPYLDRKVVEFANQLPSCYKLKGMTEKYILRRAATGLLPPEIIERRKLGLSDPISSWFTQGLGEYVRDMVRSGTFATRGYFNGSYVQHLAQRAHKRNVFDAPGHKVFLLMLLEHWQRIFIDPVTISPPAKQIP